MVTAILSVIINWFLLVFVMVIMATFASMITKITNQQINALSYYAAVIMVAWIGMGGFTPVGEWFVRKSEKCTKQPCGELLRMQSLFAEVCDRAGLDSAQYRLYISQKTELNAFATGKRTVAATTGLMRLADDEQIKGVLAHELGHHHLGHTFWGKITYFSSCVGSFAIQSYIILNAFLAIFTRIPFFGFVIYFLSWIFAAMFFVIRITISIPHRLGMMFGSRRDEFAADEFAAKLGYGNGMAKFLRTEIMPQEGDRGGFLSSFYSTHPKTYKRVQRLEQRVGFVA